MFAALVAELQVQLDLDRSLPDSQKQQHRPGSDRHRDHGDPQHLARRPARKSSANVRPGRQADRQSNQVWSRHIAMPRHLQLAEIILLKQYG